MSTYREAIQHARTGGIARCSSKVVRLLTKEEADAHALEHNPSRRTAIGVDGQPRIEDGRIVVEVYGDGDPKKLGLFEVSEGRVPFSPNEDDVQGDWRLESDQALAEIAEVPELVSPETVDEALTETATSEDETI